MGPVFQDRALEAFYRDTSFMPFAACLDGRQSWEAAWRELPSAALPVGLVAGAAVEWATLQWMGVTPPS